MLPEILAYGEAGSGKDTFGAFLVSQYNAVTLAMADPMKRFAKRLCGFDDNQLWGPSSERNKLDPRFDMVDGKPVTISEYARIEVDLGFSAGGPAGWVIDWVTEVVDRDADVGTAVMELQAWWRYTKMQAQALGGLSPRTVLQTLGTEWGRKINLSLWINNARRTQRKLLSGGYRYDRALGLLSSPGQKYDWAVVTDGRFRNEALDFRAGGALVIQIVNPEQQTLSGGVAGHASEAEQKTIPQFWFDRILINDKKQGLMAFQRAIIALMRKYTDPVWMTEQLVYESGRF